MQAMSDMARMCQQMMRQEKAATPYIVAAALTLGTLIFLVLVLLIVLEVQWIIYWNRLLKAQKQANRLS